MLKRTLSLCMAILLTICAGSCSLYPIYSNYFKTKFSYSLIEINFYSTFINIGLWACTLMTLLYNAVGTTASTAISFIFLPGAYFFIYNISNSGLNSLSIFWLIILGFILGEGSALLYINCLSTTIKSFYKSCTSDIVSLIISNMAISPCVFYSYSDMFTNGLIISDFLFLVLFIITVIILFGICLFNYYEPSTSDDFKLKMFKLNKQSLIVQIFSKINLYSLIIFLILVLINSVFSIKLPHYLVFPFAHIIYIIVVVLEGFKVFDNMVVDLVERTHGKFEGGDFGREIIIQDEININKETQNNPNLNTDINLRESNINNEFEKKINIDDKKGNITEEDKEKNDNLKLENISIIKKEMSDNYILDKNLDNIRISNESNEENNNNDEKNNNNNNNNINRNSNPFSNNININQEDQETRPSIISNINIENNQIRSELNRNRQEKIITNINNNSNFNIKDINETTNNAVINIPKSARSTINNNTEINFLNDVNRSSIMSNQIIHEDPYRDQIQVLKSLLQDRIIQGLFSLLFITIGCMISNLNNVKFIALSINSSKTNLNEYPLLYFAFNSLSIIVTNYYIKGIIHSKFVFSALLIILFIGFLSQIFGIFMNENLLYITISFAGLTHGSVTTFILLYCRFTYDLRDINTVLGILTTGNALGSLMISAIIFPLFYNYFEENGYCGGSKCFSMSYVFNSLFMLAGLFVCYIIYLKDKGRKELEEIKREQMYKDQSISVISFSNADE